MFKNKYRIVKDSYLGYEAQVKRWWFPFYWVQMGFTNTHRTIEDAKNYIKKKEVWKGSKSDLN